MGGLLDIPGYGGFLQQGQLNDQQAQRRLQGVLGALQVAQGVQPIIQQQEMRGVLAETGGDINKAIGVLASRGMTKPALDLAHAAEYQAKVKDRQEADAAINSLPEAVRPWARLAPHQFAAGQFKNPLEGASDLRKLMIEREALLAKGDTAGAALYDARIKKLNASEGAQTQEMIARIVDQQIADGAIPAGQRDRAIAQFSYESLTAPRMGPDGAILRPEYSPQFRPGFKSQSSFERGAAPTVLTAANDAEALRIAQDAQRRGVQNFQVQVVPPQGGGGTPSRFSTAPISLGDRGTVDRGTKPLRDLQEETQQYAAAMEKSGIPTSMAVLANAEKAIMGPDNKPNMEIVKYVNGIRGAVIPDNLAPTEVQNARQALQKLFNISLKDRSGAAVTVPEWDRFKKEYGIGLMKSPEQIVEGLRQARDILTKHAVTVSAGFPAEVRENYARNVGEMRAQQEPAQETTGRIRRYNPSTGRIE